MNRRSFVLGAAGAVPLLSGCGRLGGGAERPPPTPLEDGPGIVVENALDAVQLVDVTIHECKEGPSIVQIRREIDAGERVVESLDIAPGEYVVKAAMVDGPAEALFGGQWSLSGTETMHVEVTDSHIYFEEL